MITLTWKTSVFASAIHAAREIIKSTVASTGKTAANSVATTNSQELPSTAASQPNRRDPLALLPTHDLEGRTLFIESAAALTANFYSQSNSQPRNFQSRNSDPASDADSCWVELLDQACLGLPFHSFDVSFDCDADLLRDLESSYRRMYPKIDEQLLLRARPIQESWTGFGRGLMAHLKRLMQPDWIVRDATVIFVQPILGGDGIAFPKSKIFLLEAMLTNASPEIPEVLRVAWLASQMNADRLSVGKLSVDRLAEATDSTSHQQSRSLAIAMMMSTLAAGEVMELCRCDEATAAKALQLWRIDVADSSCDADYDSIAKTAITWWETYLQTRPEIGVSLIALSKMLQPNDA
jgi:hypothetical protein